MIAAKRINHPRQESPQRSLRTSTPKSVARVHSGGRVCCRPKDSGTLANSLLRELLPLYPCDQFPENIRQPKRRSPDWRHGTDYD